MKVKQLVISSAISILIIYGILIASAFYFFNSTTLRESLSDKRLYSAVWISVSAASIATLLAVIISIPAAYALSRYSFRLKPAVDIFLELPMIISPAALGALILIFFQTPLGNFIRENGMDVVYAFSGIVLAQFITVLGISTRMMKAVFDEIPVRYENIARTLGATHSQTFFKVSLPLARKGMLSAVVLTWAKAIGEFGATITVAGSMALKTETLPTAIFMKLSMADIKGTVIIILILFSISVIMLVLARLILRTKIYD
ncbi:MAG: ABC transporter permease [Bacteroidia bacterium]|nr:ABC transporter permease [Bacteroidia bacterium]